MASLQFHDINGTLRDSATIVHGVNTLPVSTPPSSHATTPGASSGKVMGSPAVLVYGLVTTTLGIMRKPTS